ncbi:hypothetical protein BJF79_28355 [Actinomadura sp. CNU-125]|uniref:AlbA family DNA-binding domain-containing protein n=1 Tax=Actinomadura sp. CNU-125 TaxID=1904961 RepID=UPI0009653B36|nr:hypothetical protein [Actinomadura sp. CNU-125]OLT38003.1 hypothetical protein BJF79_28355 [Actinomadura sp. CNU-125]
MVPSNAYLLVGVEPGQLCGVTAVDPQKLMQNLQPYIGTEIVWTPEYLEVEGLQVLVVEIAPPAPGDPIHFLMKDLFITRIKQTADGPVTKSYGFNEGTIFIRRPGETERATHEERQMLQRRARSSGAVRMAAEVVAARPNIEAAPVSPAYFARWAEELREELLAARYQPSAEEVRHRTLGWRTSLFYTSTRDRRTLDEYVAQIEAYLTEAQEVFCGLIAAELEEHPPARLALVLVNDEERPFAGVVVTATITDESVRCIDPDEQVTRELDDLPVPPAAYGTPRREPILQTPVLSPSIFHNNTYAVMARSPWRIERRAEELQVIFEPVDLRAHARVALEPVPLYIDPDAGAQEPDRTLAVRWTAAGLDSHGQKSGIIAMTVQPSSRKLDDLKAKWMAESG